MPEGEKLDAILDALRQVLERPSNSNKPAPEVDPRRRFYDMFSREAKEYDRDFLKKSHDDLNTTLIFAGLFSAVAAAFIVDIQQELRPNYQALSFTALTMLLNTTSGIPNHGDPPVPVPVPPKQSVIRVQAMLFCTLITALFAAFLATLGIQWLNFYVEGSLIDRSRHRELRMRGMMVWRFKLFLELVPLVLQLSMFLLGIALALYMRDISPLISDVIGILTILIIIFFVAVIIAGTLWKTCPFQTPVSRIIHHLSFCAKQHQRSVLQEVKDQFSRLVIFWKRNQPTPTTALEMTADGSPARELLALQFAGVIPLEEDEGTHVSDTNCISTMFKFAHGSDAIEAVVEFILEVNWVSDVGKVPILEVCRTLRRSFELLKDGRAIVRPGMREQARGSAKALLHMWLQRLCIGSIVGGRTVAASLEPLLHGYRSKEDHELASTLQVLDVVVHGSGVILWEEFVFSDYHYCWLSHIIRFRAWLALKYQRLRLPKDVSEFIRHSLSKNALPPRVTADCLLVVHMIVGGRPDLDDKMLIKDKSGEIGDIIHQIYRSIESSLGQYSWNAKRGCTIEALELLEPLKQEALCVESYGLFRKVMDKARNNSTITIATGAGCSTVVATQTDNAITAATEADSIITAATEADSMITAATHLDNSMTAPAQMENSSTITAPADGSLWRLAGIFVSGAFKWHMNPPRIGDPGDLVDFLDHCIKEEQNLDGPMERVMLALGGATPGELSNGLAKLEVTEKPFLEGICHALREDAPHLLQRATVIFLRHLDGPLFDPNRLPAGKTHEDLFGECAPDLVSRWSISAEKSLALETPDLLLVEALVTTFAGLLDSPFWRTYIPDGRWETRLRLVGNLDGELPHSLLRCFQNRGIIEYLRDQKRPQLAKWLSIAWTRYPYLSPEVKQQLIDETKTRPLEIPAYLSGLDRQIERDRERLSDGRARSSEAEFSESKARLKKLRSARRTLEKMRDSPSSS